MRWLIGILGLVLGIVAGVALLLFNPLMVRGPLASLKANLVPDKSYRMDDYRGMSPDLNSLLRGGAGSGENALAAPALANLRIAIIVLPAGDGRPAALAVKVSTVAEQTHCGAQPVRSITEYFPPGEGSVFSLYRATGAGQVPGDASWLMHAKSARLSPHRHLRPADWCQRCGWSLCRLHGEIREGLLPATASEPGWQLSLKASPPPLRSR
jgi:hypothetical protein